MNLPKPTRTLALTILILSVVALAVWIRYGRSSSRVKETYMKVGTCPSNVKASQPGTKLAWLLESTLNTLYKDISKRYSSISQTWDGTWKYEKSSSDRICMTNKTMYFRTNASVEEFEKDLKQQWSKNTELRGYFDDDYEAAAIRLFSGLIYGQALVGLRSVIPHQDTARYDKVIAELSKNILPFAK